jgi:predicted ATP-grasp superfamily ATP-dependent carboligase
MMEAIAEMIAVEYDLRGCNGIDFVIDGERVYVLEVNPRLQGSLEVVEKAAGTGIIDAHVRSCLGEVPSKVSIGRGYWGRKVVFAANEIGAPPLAELGFVKDIPAPGTRIRACAPVCTVVGYSRSTEGLLSALAAKEKRVIRMIQDSSGCPPSPSSSVPPSWSGSAGR